MKKYPLIGVCICNVILLVLGSLSNVVGYQTLQSSNHKMIKEEINQRELLFQTICDLTNNKEIQRIIIKSQMSRGLSPTLDISEITKNQLKVMYFIGMIYSKVISKSSIQSLIGKYQFDNQEIQKEISAIIDKNISLKSAINQLSSSDCDCENEKTTGLWKFPVICSVLYFLVIFFMILWVLNITVAKEFGEFFGQIAYDMDCFWTPYTLII